MFRLPIYSITVLYLSILPTFSFAATCPVLTQTLKQGSNHAEVALLRTYLTESNFLKVETKKKKTFDKPLSDALTEWQIQHVPTIAKKSLGTTDAKTRIALKKCGALSAIGAGACLLGEKKVAHGSRTQAYDATWSPCNRGVVRTCTSKKLTPGYSLASCGNTKEKLPVTNTHAASFFVFNDTVLHKMAHYNLGEVGTQSTEIFDDRAAGLHWFKIVFSPRFQWKGSSTMYVGRTTSERNSAGIDSSGRRSFTVEQYEIPRGTQNMSRYMWDMTQEWLEATYISMPADMFPSRKPCTQKSIAGCEFIRPHGYRWVKNFELPKTDGQKPTKLGMWNATPPPPFPEYLARSEYDYTGETYIAEALHYPEWNDAVFRAYIDTQVTTEPRLKPSTGLRPKLRSDVAAALIVRHYAQCGGLDTTEPEKDCKVFADYIYGKDVSGNPLGEIGIIQGVTPHPLNWAGMKDGRAYWSLQSISYAIDA
ncbi:MAG: hypothetical protein RI911_945 [Candidatus Parcubacteria bacterium]|jgi:hypothetical protein